jgi:drug/metabolite transporter (DMT)-like permease
MMSASLRGILSMLAAVAAFAIMDVSIERLVETYPAIQVTFLRGFASIPFLLAGTALFGRWSDLIPRRWKLHVVRGVLAAAVLWLFVYSVKLLSLGDAYSIFMVNISSPTRSVALRLPCLRRSSTPRSLGACCSTI